MQFQERDFCLRSCEKLSTKTGRVVLCALRSSLKLSRVLQDCEPHGKNNSFSFFNLHQKLTLETAWLRDDAVPFVQGASLKVLKGKTRNIRPTINDPVAPVHNTHCSNKQATARPARVKKKSNCWFCHPRGVCKPTVSC